MIRGRTTVLGQRRLMLLVALIAAAFVLFFPARQLVQQRRHIDGLEQRVNALRAENAKLSQEVARLEDPSELEVLARDRLGLVRPGERAYFLSPQERPAAPAALKVQPHRSWWSRTWERFVSLLRGRG
jgi:cell division protein FtsL